MRLFLAIPIPNHWKNELAKYAQTFSDLKGINWVNKENLHVTLLFIGEFKEADLTDLQSGLAKAYKNILPFELEFDQVIWAPPKKRPPHMIWALLNNSLEFEHLENQTYLALKSFLLEIKKPRRPATPHITIARIKNPKAAQQIEITQPDLKNHKFLVNKIQLVSSTLTAKGPHYKIIKEFDL